MKVVVLNECQICRKLFNEHEALCPRCGSDKSEFITARIVGNAITKRPFEKNDSKEYQDGNSSGEKT